MTIYLSLLIAIVGGLALKLSTNPDTKHLGGYAFLAGLLAFLLQIRPESFTLLR